MVPVEQPDADCGHDTDLWQQCGRCSRWCCRRCYSPWTALACCACRRAIAGAALNAVDDFLAGVNAAPGPERLPLTAPGRCRDRSRTRPDVAVLAERIADLERRLEELGSADCS